MCRRVCSFMRAPRLMKEESAIDGWSISRWPTPGRAATPGMPRSLQMADRADAGAQQMRRRMDRARRQDHLAARGTPVSWPSTMAVTPTQRVPSNSSDFTCVSVEIVRFGRLRVSASR